MSDKPHIRMMYGEGLWGCERKGFFPIRGISAIHAYIRYLEMRQGIGVWANRTSP